jgi:hypothetical protein
MSQSYDNESFNKLLNDSGVRNLLCNEEIDRPYMPSPYGPCIKYQKLENAQRENNSN